MSRLLYEITITLEIIAQKPTNNLIYTFLLFSVSNTVNNTLNEFIRSGVIINICFEIATKCFGLPIQANVTVTPGSVTGIEWPMNGKRLFDEIMRKLRVVSCEIKPNVEIGDNSEKLPETEDVQNNSLYFFFTMVNTNMFVFTRAGQNSSQVFLTAELCFFED